MFYDPLPYGLLIVNMIGRVKVTEIQPFRIFTIEHFGNMFPEETRFYMENGIETLSRLGCPRFPLLNTIS